MWCRTAWPSTRSKESSSNGSSSASQATVSTSTPMRAALACSASSMPGEMSVATAWRTTPSCSMFSVK